MTINRGLIMLLNNDYYLDIKNSLMAQEIYDINDNLNLTYDILREHINNLAIHEEVSKYDDSDILDRLDKLENTDSTEVVQQKLKRLTEDTVIYIPITYNAASINKIIEETPHDLGGYTLVFYFVIPEGYVAKTANVSGIGAAQTQYYQEYICNLRNSSISFDGFINGILVIAGDDLLAKKDSDGNFIPSYKNSLQIQNPKRYDGLDIEDFISNLFKKIDNPSKINDVVSYKTAAKIINKDTCKNKIIIQGTSLNTSYSLASISNVLAKTYIYNLEFRNSLADGDGKTIYINSGGITEYPTSDKFLCQWTLETNGEPTVSDALMIYMNQSSSEMLFNQYTHQVSGVYLPQMNILGGEANRLLSGFNEIFHDDRGQIISTDETYKSDVEKVINELTKAIELYNQIPSLIPPSYDYNDYLYDEALDTSLVSGDFSKLYDVASEDFMSRLKSTYSLSAFNTCLSISPDLIQDVDLEELGDLTPAQYYYDNVFVPEIEKIEESTSKILAIIQSLLSLYSKDNIKRELTLKEVGKLSYTGVDLSTNSEKQISTDSADGKIHAATFTVNNSLNEVSYLYGSGNAWNKIYSLIYDSHNWHKIRQKYTETESENPITNSQKDITMTFWTKNNAQSDLQESTFFSNFIRDAFNFEVTSISFSTLDNGSFTNSALNSLLQRNVEYANITEKDSWIFWAIRFDNSFRDIDPNKYDKKMGIVISAIYYAQDEEDSSKYVQKLCSMNVLIPGLTILSSLRQTSYVSQIEEENYNNSNFYVGHSQVPNPNGTLNNRYFQGYMRNLTLFKGHLTDNELKNFMADGILNAYDFPNVNEQDALKELFSSKYFYLGLIGIFSTKDIRLINCDYKYNGNKFIIN